MNRDSHKRQFLFQCCKVFLSLLILTGYFANARLAQADSLEAEKKLRPQSSIALSECPKTFDDSGICRTKEEAEIAQGGVADRPPFPDH